jgi:hypothetical protein
VSACASAMFPWLRLENGKGMEIPATSAGSPLPPFSSQRAPPATVMSGFAFAFSRATMAVHASFSGSRVELVSTAHTWAECTVIVVS